MKIQYRKKEKQIVLQFSFELTRIRLIQFFRLEDQEIDLTRTSREGQNSLFKQTNSTLFESYLSLKI